MLVGPNQVNRAALAVVALGQQALRVQQVAAQLKHLRLHPGYAHRLGVRAKAEQGKAAAELAQQPSRMPRHLDGRDMTRPSLRPAAPAIRRPVATE